jgi:ADP-L-glycero-D-manno-heptose 6-epimerase
MRLLITGTKGFIGKNLKDHFSDCEIFTFEESDIVDNWKIRIDSFFLNGIDAVFHVGACSNTLEQNVNYMMLLNYEVTKYITDLCVMYNVPLIYSSSAANYGTNNEYPSNLYGWSKYVGEGYVVSNNGIALRYFNVYGCGEENKGKMSSVTYQMFMKNRNNESIKLFPKKPKRDFVYIKDIISANIYALENYKNLSGKWYEVGFGESNLFESILDYMNIEYSYHDESVIPEGYQFYTCSSKDRWMDGWRPKYSLKLGIKDYLPYLKNLNK